MNKYKGFTIALISGLAGNIAFFIFYYAEWNFKYMVPIFILCFIGVAVGLYLHMKIVFRKENEVDEKAKQPWEK